jgi:hypothetical protein
MDLIAIDPGTRELGAAHFSRTLLTKVELIRAKGAEEMITAVRAKCTAWWADKLVIERPQVYGYEGKADPNDLALVTLIVGTVVGAVQQYDDLRLPYPAVWKGQVPKDIMEQRMWSILGEAETRALRQSVEDVPPSVRHNVYDAVQLGLWALGRQV